MTSSRNPIDFQTTHWSIVRSSRENGDSVVRRESLGELYQAYWYPLFIYLRRKGYDPESSADYVQGFFVELIDKDFLRSVAPEKGRFRWFMQSAVQRFAAGEVKRLSAKKRGGGRAKFSLNVDEAEGRYQLEPEDGWTPESLFDRRWALTVLQQALGQLQTEYGEKDKSALFDSLAPMLTIDSDDLQAYDRIAEQLSMSTGAVKVAAHRMRERYREVLTAVVAQTLADPDALDDEIDILLKALRGPAA
ncbi:MAG: hypothetical protein AAF456_16085 [Planctomycetota bacterium]